MSRWETLLCYFSKCVLLDIIIVKKNLLYILINYYLFFLQNKTKVVNKYGTTLNYFQSLFPHGCTISNNYSSNRKRTVLDCIYSYKLKKYYILDIIEWIGVPYTDFDVCIF